MEALHCIPKEIALNHLVPGVPKLKEIFWIVPTDLMDMAAGQIPNKIGMRQPRHNGLTDGQVKFRTRICINVNSILSGQGLRRLTGEKNRWVGNNQPKFFLGSFCPYTLPGDKKVYDSILIPEKVLWKVKWNYGGYIRSVESKYRCTITIPDKKYPVQKMREIGLFGFPPDLEYVKKNIVDRVISGATFIPAIQC